MTHEEHVAFIMKLVHYRESESEIEEAISNALCEAYEAGMNDGCKPALRKDTK